MPRYDYCLNCGSYNVSTDDTMHRDLNHAGRLFVWRADCGEELCHGVDLDHAVACIVANSAAADSPRPWPFRVVPRTGGLPGEREVLSTRYDEYAPWVDIVATIRPLR